MSKRSFPCSPCFYIVGSFSPPLFFRILNWAYSLVACILDITVLGTFLTYFVYLVRKFHERAFFCVCVKRKTWPYSSNKYIAYIVFLDWLFLFIVISEILFWRLDQNLVFGRWCQIVVEVAACYICDGTSSQKLKFMVCWGAWHYMFIPFLITLYGDCSMRTEWLMNAQRQRRGTEVLGANLCQYHLHAPKKPRWHDRRSRKLWGGYVPGAKVWALQCVVWLTGTKGFFANGAYLPNHVPKSKICGGYWYFQLHGDGGFILEDHIHNDNHKLALIYYKIGCNTKLTLNSPNARVCGCSFWFRFTTVFSGITGFEVHKVWLKTTTIVWVLTPCQLPSSRSKSKNSVLENESSPQKVVNNRQDDG
jgi:hypothetical protein